MKLVFAIIHDDDSPKVMDELNRNGFMVTKLCSSGGFLKAGNTTLIVGIDESCVEQVLKIIEEKSRSRKQMINSSTATGSPIGGGVYMSYPVEVTLGGATVFILDVESFHKF
jgi:uncharacterized protein YaaQ